MYAAFAMGHRAATLGVLMCAFISSGALTACPTVDLGDTPTDINLCNPAAGREYFDSMVWPEFVRPDDATNSCARSGGCHIEGGGTPLNFKTNPVDLAFNYRQAQVFLNCGTPEASSLLTKPLAGSDPHGGSDVFANQDDPAVQVFLGWFE